MSEKVKLIIEIPKDYYEIIKHDVENNLTDYRPFEIIGNGTPLDDVKAEIFDKAIKDASGEGFIFLGRLLRIFDNIGKAESIDPNDMARMFDGVTEIPKDAFKGWTTEELLEQIRAKGRKETFMVFMDNAVSKNCKNLSESYGEICVKCNKCGRFDEHIGKAESEDKNMLKTNWDEMDKQEIAKSVVLLDVFTKTYCRYQNDYERFDDLKFRCDECPFSKSDGGCICKEFKNKYAPDYKDFGSMGDS